MNVKICYTTRYKVLTYISLRDWKFNLDVKRLYVVTKVYIRGYG